MKSIKTIFASVVLIALVSISAFAGTNAKVIAVINKASWCPVCQKNGMRAMQTFKANDKDMAIQFVANDLTNDATKEKSAAELKKLGLEKEMEPNTATGVVYFFNANTKALISHVSIAKTDQELSSALESAKKDVK